MKKKTGQTLEALTSIFSVELPGIEPAVNPLDSAVYLRKHNDATLGNDA